MKKTLLFIMAVILLGCDKINQNPEQKPFEQDYKFKEEYILLKRTANIEYITKGIKDVQSLMDIDFDPSLEISLNGEKVYLGQGRYSLSEINNITIYPSKAGKFTLKIKISGKPELVIPLVVNERGYVIENLLENTEIQATYKYQTKFRIVDKADSTDAYTKRKYEISAMVINQGKSTILVGGTKIACDTTANFLTTFAKDQSFEFEGEFTPWGGGEYEVFYRVMDDEGIIVDCPVKYNVKPTQVDFKVLNNSGAMNVTDKGIKLDLSLTPPKGTQSAYYVALEDFYKDELYQLDEQGAKITGGVKRQIVGFKQHDGQTINTSIYLQTDKVMSGQRFDGKFVLYSTGSERWETTNHQTYPKLEPKITYTTNDLVAFGDNNMVYLTYEFDKKVKPTKDAKLKMKIISSLGDIRLPNGMIMEKNLMIDVTEFFSENTNPMQRTIPLTVFPTNTDTKSFSFTANLYDDFGSDGSVKVKVDSKLNNLEVEAKGEFTSTFPNAIDIKMVAKFETTGQNDTKLNNLKFKFWPPSTKKIGYFVINGVEIRNDRTEYNLTNTSGTFEMKYIPLEAGNHSNVLKFTTQDGREKTINLFTTHN